MPKQITVYSKTFDALIENPLATTEEISLKIGVSVNVIRSALSKKGYSKGTLAKEALKNHWQLKKQGRVK